MRTSLPRPTPAGAGVLGGLIGAGAAVGAGRLFVARQAALARRRIGKPLGEEALVVDRVYRKRLGDPVDLLVLGDSIAAGLGAQTPQRSFGGQLARRLGTAVGRSVRLRSVAVVGAETSSVAAQLASLPDGYRPDVAVVVVGGNDVIHRVRLASSREQLGSALRALRGLGCGVVVGTCPDLGAVRTVPQPLRTFISVLSRQLASAQRAVALAEGAYAVSLAEVVGPFFVAQPDEMFSVDTFHPSEAGYRRTAKAMLPSLLLALGEETRVPFGHHVPTAGPAPLPERG